MEYGKGSTRLEKFLEYIDPSVLIRDLTQAGVAIID